MRAMRLKEEMFILGAVAVLAVLLVISLARIETTPASAHADASAPPTRGATEEAAATAVFADEAAGVVRIMAGGKEVVTIDGQGLHVRGNIDYSGLIADTGPASPQPPN